jgi:hypothetical protein
MRVSKANQTKPALRRKYANELNLLKCKVHLEKTKAISA